MCFCSSLGIQRISYLYFTITELPNQDKAVKLGMLVGFQNIMDPEGNFPVLEEVRMETNEHVDNPLSSCIRSSMDIMNGGLDTAGQIQVLKGEIEHLRMENSFLLAENQALKESMYISNICKNRILFFILYVNLSVNHFVPSYH